MRKRQTFFSWLYRAVLAAVFVVAWPRFVCAAGLNGLFSILPDREIGGFLYLLCLICYILGFYMIAAGVVGYHKRENNTVTEPVRKNIARIIVGGIIIAVPAFTGVLQGSFMIPGTGPATLERFAGLSFPSGARLLP